MNNDHDRTINVNINKKNTIICCVNKIQLLASRGKYGRIHSKESQWRLSQSVILVCDNELVLNLKMGKTECMIFGTAKRLNALNGRQLALSVNGTLINTTSSLKYLGQCNLGFILLRFKNLESHFDKMYKKAAGRFNLLGRIRPLIDKSSAEKIYKAIIWFNLFLRIVELWVSAGHVTVRVELKALNIEVRKFLVEVINSRQWKIWLRNSPASLRLIVSRIMSVPLLKVILQKLNTTLTLETMGVP